MDILREEIRKKVWKAVKEEWPKIKLEEVLIEVPENDKYGDYSTNIAMKLAGVTRKSPIEISESINEKLKIKSEKFLDKIEIARPGFVNFFISKEYLQKQIEEILKQKEKFGDLKIGKNKKVNIEFISANPTGPLTIGNARGGVFGDVLGNILKKSGYKVEKEYYINDFGNQVIALGHSVLKDKDAVYKGDYINKLHKKVKEKDIFKAGQQAAKIIIEEIIKKTVKEMGIQYDNWFWENQLHKKKEVDKTIEMLKKKKLIYKKDDAYWFKSRKFQDNRDRVLIKKDGSKTYLAGDIAYHRNKLEKRRFDNVIDVWGADHAGDIAGLKAGVEALGYKDKVEIILHQFVTILKKGEKQRMSKRKGVYFTMDELIEEVGRDVMRFFFLQKTINTHLNFDLDLAKEDSEKNPIYYIQYAYARICSIIHKFDKPQVSNSKFNLLEHPSELKLIKQLVRFPEIIEDISKDYQVQRLPQYALALASVFHQFYQDCKVISDNKNLSQVRLALIQATKIVLKNCLDLMGISAPQKM